MATNTTAKANVFIIESLTLQDEKRNRFEGQVLSQILHLGGKETLYYYIRTRRELERMLRVFAKSNYRYLHLSCHGSKTSLLTTLDEVTFEELGQICRPYLNNKRLFISACAAVNGYLAAELFPRSGCISIIGPNKDIFFDDAAIAWATFYHMVFKENSRKMTERVISRALRTIRDAYGVKMKYYTKDDESANGFKLHGD